MGVFASTLLGRPEFIAEVSEAHASRLQPDRNVPAVKQLTSSLSAEKVIEAAKEVAGEDSNLLRKLSIHLCHRYTGMKLKEIGALFDIGDAAVSVTSKRLLAQAEKERETREVLKRVRKLLMLRPDP